MGEKKVVVKNGEFAGSIWIIGWLFTLGFCHFAFWKGVLALLLWPYYLGSMLAPAIGG